MNSARIVYIIVGLFILSPWVVWCLNKIIGELSKRERKFPLTYIVLLPVISAAIILFTFSLYKFTIGYQAPLAAENIYDIFIERIEENLTVGEYEQRMKASGWAHGDFEPMGEDEFQEAGFISSGYTLSLSERVFNESGNNAYMYGIYKRSNSDIYTRVNMIITDNKWQVTSIEVVTKEDIDEDDNRMRFYQVRP